MADISYREHSLTLSIIVLNWNLGRMTQECLASIRAHTSNVEYEIIVVDNGSRPDEKSTVRDACHLHDARLIELNQNLFFGEANNIGAEAARGDAILFLNNDVVVTPGYIGPLLHALETAHRAGAVGAELRYPNGQLQEVGGYVRPDGWTIRHGLARSPASVLSEPGLHIVDYCSAACLLLRRDTFLAAGGFDPLFDPGYFEDVDLMLRLRAMGLFTYCCAGTTVIHKESATSTAIWSNPRRAAIIHRNHRKFVDRWGKFIQERVFGTATPPHFDRVDWVAEHSRSDGTRNLLLQGSGLIGRNRTWLSIIRVASALRDSAHVTFVADEACSRSRIYTIAMAWGQTLGEFSIARTSDVKYQPDDTMAFIRVNDHGDAEIVSGEGPLLEIVANFLSTRSAYRPLSDN
ncbi:glycosyltransferase family 2 protein [Bradyrhizobium sp. G127]|uniref:glycosyltransferase family 2 protein n=1 Tax=Bradyrhizobium sp. G127 TaxID=2904800 RepID=UPI001F2DE368|nr:glycosyltransferase family 2 protein [Bradyrhizobium sp. G127]MCF2524814.1 glycosyltransferase family 2 protein [Bradyrhizobium sp. G127]